jgi:hypothetical protein
VRKLGVIGITVIEIERSDEFAPQVLHMFLMLFNQTRINRYSPPIFSVTKGTIAELSHVRLSNKQAVLISLPLITILLFFVATPHEIVKQLSRFHPNLFTGVLIGLC